MRFRVLFCYAQVESVWLQNVPFGWDLELSDFVVLLRIQLRVYIFCQYVSKVNIVGI